LHALHQIFLKKLRVFLKSAVAGTGNFWGCEGFFVEISSKLSQKIFMQKSFYIIISVPVGKVD